MPDARALARRVVAHTDACERRTSRLRIGELGARIYVHGVYREFEILPINCGLPTQRRSTMVDLADPIPTEHAYAPVDDPRPPATSRHRARLLITLLVVLVVAVGAGIWIGSTAVARPSTSPPASTQTSLVSGGDLFVVDGTSGSALSTGAGSWTLRLSHSNVLWFRDRPFRGSGTESAGAFVAAWSRNFGQVPPYGAILAPAGPRGHHPTAVRLTDPTFDQSTGVVSFTLVPDRGESAADAAWLSQLTVHAAPKNGRVILFVDDSGPSASVNGCAIQPGTHCGADMSFADLAGVDLAGSVLDQTYRGSITEPLWTGVDLAGANLTGATVDDLDMTDANLQNADLTNASMVNVDLTGANLTSANLTSSNLSFSEMADANLTDANLTNANLSYAYLYGTNLTGAQMQGVSMLGTVWQNATCPDGTNSNTDGGTCEGHLTP